MSGKGSGRRPGTGYAEGLERIIGTTCPHCRGKGYVVKKDIVNGPTIEDCPKCKDVKED